MHFRQSDTRFRLFEYWIHYKNLFPRPTSIALYSTLQDVISILPRRLIKRLSNMALNTSTMTLWTDLRTLISDRKSIVTLSNNFGNEHKISSSVYKTNSAFEIVRNHCVVVNVIAFGFKSINLLKQPKANENLLEMFYATIRRPVRPPRNLVPVDITTIKHRFKLSKTM